jgi:hypothetical protein
MCATNGTRNPRARWMMVLGNFSLVVALLTWSFSRHWPGAAHAGLASGWVDGISGLFFGVSIGANLAALRLRRRCAASATTLQG